MAEATLKLGLDLSEVNSALGAVEERLRRAATAASNVGRGGGGNSATQRAEQEALRLAQAQARLQVTTGNLTGAQTTLQRALENTNQESIAAIRTQIQLEQVNQRAAAGWRRHAGTIREAGESLQNAGYVFSAVSGRILDVGRAAVQSAVDIDRQVNVLKALTGSAGAAEARFKALFQLSQRTPGLTTNLALTLDAQLRTAQVTQQTIDKILPSIGRLNAVSPLGDPQKFAQNLVQLVTQNFERTDLKELVGQSPIAGTIIRELFNVDNPTNAKAIREAAERLGIKTTDDFFRAFAEAAAKNQGLANVTESLGTQFDKLRDRALVALRPLGLEIINTLGPLIEKAVPLIEQLSASFAALPQGTREAIVVIGALTALLGPLTIALGAATQAVGALGSLASVIGGAAGLGGAGAAVGTFTVILAGAAVEAAALKDAYQTNFGDLRDIVQGFVAEATAFWANYGDEIKSVTQAVWGFVKTYIVDTVTGVLEAVRGILALLNGNWEVGLRSLFSAAQKFLALLVPAFVKTGQDLIKGLIDGVVNKASEFKDTLKAIAASGLAAVKLVWGIRSPSYEMFKIGEQTIDGLILGARSKAKQAEIEFQQIQKTIIKAATPPDLIAGLREQEGIRRDQQYLLGFIPSPGAGPIPGGDIPTPKIIREAAEAIKEIPPPPPIAAELSNAARFAKGFAAEIESAGDIFERFGRNVSGSFRNVTDLFRNLGNAFKNLFLDLIGNGLQRIVSGGLNSLFSALSGGRTGGGIGGALGNIFGGGGGGAFRTPSFNPSSGGNFLSGLLGGGITAPNSITPTFVGGLPTFGNVPVPLIGGGGLPGGGGLAGLFGKGGSFLSNIFSGAGGALLPFLGAGLGSGLGGQSTLGRILGGIGGGAVGLGVSFGASVFGALGGGFGALGPAALAALGPAALIGAPLLIGALLLGRAAARKKDEATSGDSLQRAIDQIKDLKRQADSGQLTSIAEAESSFTQIHRQFISETLQLKTRSVRESRLNNQGDITPPLHPDSLRLLFEREALPAIIAANTRRGVFDKLIPEFATGGVMGRTGLALLHDGEVIMNAVQQRRLTSLAGADVFARVGVPNAVRTVGTGTPSFANGGVFTANGNGNNNSSPVVISELTVEFNVGPDLATEIVKVGGSTADGRKVTVQNVRTALRNGEI